MGCNENNSIPIPVLLLKEVFFWDDSEKIMLRIVQPTLFTFGLTLNMFFLLIVYLDKNMRTITNFYLANLSVADSIFLTYTATDGVLSILMTPYSGERTFIGEYGCIVHCFIYYTSFFEALYLVTAVVIERFLAICHPLKHRRVAGKARTCRIVILTWIVALITATLYVPILGSNEVSCIQPVPYDPTIPTHYAKCRPLNGISRTYQRIGDPVLQMIPFGLSFIGRHKEFSNL